MNKRVIWGILIGIILGVLCIIGASLRMPGELSITYLFSFWFNRVIMGLVIGLFMKPKDIKIALLRGVILGALVSFSFYSATEFRDFMGFFAGVVYGIIIETVLYYKIK
jgi:hypothetical protein